ncbi:hypothetical protein BS17DRAFT_541916 [Gyrodon lividus]|nr:hypothetical protein BS17DRAFT_541916 [Gyrodon lividus]
MRLVEVVFCLSVSVTILCQAAITLRVWYLFSRSRIIRVFALTVFIMTTIAAVIIAAKLWPRMQKELQALSSGDVTGLSNLPPVWYFYVPSLIIHSTLFALKVYRFAISPSSMQTETLLWRFLKEGMLMYAFATGSLLFSVIGLSMMQFSQLPVHVAALEGSMVAATALISVCRATLSIGSLAATAHVDPEWLLNHAELSRVRWRRGAEGEIVVDVGEGGIPLPEVPVSPKAAEPLILGGRRR